MLYISNSSSTTADEFIGTLSRSSVLYTYASRQAKAKPKQLLALHPLSKRTLRCESGRCVCYVQCEKDKRGTKSVERTMRVDAIDTAGVLEPSSCEGAH